VLFIWGRTDHPAATVTPEALALEPEKKP